MNRLVYFHFTPTRMSRVYINIQGFTFTDKKYDTNCTMVLNVIDSKQGATKKFTFNGSESSKIKKSYNIGVRDPNGDQTFTIELYRKKFFAEELIGKVEIPISFLEVDKLTYNMLELISENNFKHPVVLRVVLHLASQCHAFKCPVAIPKLKQFDITGFARQHVKKHENRMSMETKLLKYSYSF